MISVCVLYITSRSVCVVLLADAVSSVLCVYSARSIVGVLLTPPY